MATSNNKEVRGGIVMYLDGREVENSAGAIQAEMKKLRKEINNCTIGSEEYVAATQKYQQLNAILQEHRRNLGQVVDANKQAKLAGQSYAEQVVSMLGLNSRFGSSLSALGSGKNVFANLSTAAGAFGKTLLGLLSNPVFLTIAGVGGTVAVFKFWYDYNKGLAEATRLTHEFLNVSGDELVIIRSDIQALADAYGKDYKTVLQSVDALTSQYGITSQQALQVIRDGFVAGADESGNFLEQLGEYAPTFHDIGIGANELAALISQTRSGIFSEQGMNAIQMAGKRIREMGADVQEALRTLDINPDEITKGLREGSISTFDVIQTISEKLKSLDPQSREVGEVLKDVFGKQGAAAGYQLVTAFADVSTSIEDCKKQTGEYGAAMEKYLETQSELNRITAALFDMTQSGFEGMTVDLKTIATKWLVAVMKGVVDVVNWFIELYNESTAVRLSIANIGSGFTNLWALAKVTISNIIMSFKNVGVILKGLLESLESVATLDFASARDALTKMFEDVGKNAKSGIDYAKSTMTDALVDDVNAISGAVSNRIKPIVIPVSTEGEAEAEVSSSTGSSSDGESGNGGSGGDGGSGSNSNSTEEERKKRVKKALEAIETESNRKLAELKQQYIDGEIKSEEEYSQMAEQIELERLKKSLEVAGLEPAEREKLMNKVQDIYFNAKKQINDWYDQLENDQENSFDRTIAKLEDAKNEEKQVIDHAHSLGILSEEDYQKALLALDEKYNRKREDAYKRSEEYKRRLREMAATIYNSESADKNLKDEHGNKYNWLGYYKSLHSEIEKAKSDLANMDPDSEEYKLAEDYLDGLIKIYEDKGRILTDVMSGIGESLGSALGNWIQGSKRGVQDAFKSLLLVVVDGIEKMIEATMIVPTLEAILGPATWAKALADLAKIAAVKVAFTALKTSIQGWESGGYTGVGAHDEPAGIVHRGEFVANRFALANPAIKSVLDLIDGAQRSGSVQNLTTEDISAAGSRTSSPSAPSAASTPQNIIVNSPDNADLMELLQSLKQRLEEPIEAYTYVEGRGGIKHAQNRAEQLRNNAIKVR